MTDDTDEVAATGGAPDEVDEDSASDVERERIADGPLEPPPAGRGVPPLAVTIVLGVIVVALAVLLVILLRDRSDLRAETDRHSEIATAVSDFGAAVLTYEHTDIDATVAAVNALATERLQGELADGYLGLLRAQIEALEATSTAEVIDVLVSDTRGDAARAIAIIRTDISSTNTKAQVTAYLEVSLLRVGGEWLANEMKALTTEGGLVDDTGNPIDSLPGPGADADPGDDTTPEDGEDSSGGLTTIPDESEE